MLAKPRISNLIGSLLLTLLFASSINSQQLFNPDTVQAKRFDTGKMWTFDYPPIEYWNESLNFNATEDWLNHVQLSTLRIPGCTASFASEDGLIVTNHHCSTWHRDAVQKEGEDLFNNGFYAETLEDERDVPNMYADQLKLIRDVTDKVVNAMNEANTDDEKIKARDEKIGQLESMYTEETGLKCEIKSYYGGAKYALHGYKRYTNLKLVFVAEEAVGMYGGDYDNFTYPRYNLDYAFFRIYDDEGQPLKTENYYKWNTSGVELGELLFIIGSPGSTNRLQTAEQLKYYRDVTYRNYSYLLSSYYQELQKLLNDYPERHDEFAGIMTGVGNSEKVYKNILKGLRDPYLIARKEAFDTKLQETINADPELKEKYGHIWDAIKNTRDEARNYGEKIAAYTIVGSTSPAYFKIATDLIDLAEQLEKPEDERLPKYSPDQLDETIDALYPEEFDTPVELAKLRVRLNYIRFNLGTENNLVQLLTNGKTDQEAVDYVLSVSKLTNKNDVKELASSGPDQILNSEDPFIQYILKTRDELAEINAKYDEINETEEVLEQLLGEAMYAIYGTTIPPDANRSMRIGDGTVKIVEYNGTIAPSHTTFYGLFDRYYSHNKKFPWDLPERWVNYPENFELSTPLNFITDIDVIGGQSGSPIINKAGEFVGVAFDGNLESIVGSFIFMPENNRSVTVAAEAILQALKYIYKADRIVKEIEKNIIVK